MNLFSVPQLGSFLKFDHMFLPPVTENKSDYEEQSQRGVEPQSPG